MLVFFLGGLFLLFERVTLWRHARRIPLRIAVTGTRGKSTVTRLIAASLREAHFSVMAKTTGSKPVIIFPDGGEAEICRKGRPSILEGKKILKQAADCGAQALVVEMMSIQPECLAQESRRILRPHCLVITNVRLDHREEMGRTKGEIARSLASAIPPLAAVFVPDEEFYPDFQAACDRLKARIIRVRKDETESEKMHGEGIGSAYFEENLRITLAVSRSLGVPSETAWKGITKAEPDFGGLKVFQAEFGRPPVSWLLVSAFAANDPESTAAVLSRIKQSRLPSGGPLVGILNFRSDRGERTAQWLEALENGFFWDFDTIYAIGAHVHTLRMRRTRKIRANLIPLAGESPAEIMVKVTSEVNRSAVLIGMGNMGGLGEKLVRFWEERGKPYAL